MTYFGKKIKAEISGGTNFGFLSFNKTCQVPGTSQILGGSYAALPKVASAFLLNVLRKNGTTQRSNP